MLRKQRMYIKDITGIKFGSKEELEQSWLKELDEPADFKVTWEMGAAGDYILKSGNQHYNYELDVVENNTVYTVIGGRVCEVQQHPEQWQSE